MRKIAAALLGCLLLAGCASSWEQQLRYKIVSVDNTTPTEFFKLELVGDVPKDVLWQDRVASQLQPPGDISGDPKVGDEVICTATQKQGSPFASWSKDTKLSGCKKA
ncbi:hypothetical protein [Lentzea sp. NPDC004782]|uniref:hypothetical protein n=1 Tax=Lentzea sp. NPDC004782 TaxID=3154458 RepID=UPI0033BA09C0